MSNRQRKASKRRKTLAMSTFNLESKVKARDTEPLYQRKFSEGDMEWLADKFHKQKSSDLSLTLENFADQYNVPRNEFRLFCLKRYGKVNMEWLASEYQRQSDFDPYLTVKEFAKQHGVSAHKLCQHLPDSVGSTTRFVTLWHGTSRTRAKAIKESGFVAKKGIRKRTFFTRHHHVACGYARHRAERERDQPVVIMCSIDLNLYDDFIRPASGVFAFNHACIPGEVIEKVDKPTDQTNKRRKKQKGTNIEHTYIALTYNSSRAGIAYFLNGYLGLDDTNRIGADHEAIGKIKEWMDKQISIGEFGEVSVDKISEQIQKYLPDCSARQATI